MVVALVAAALVRGDWTLAAPALPVLLACCVGFADDRSAMRPVPKMLLLLGAAATALPFAVVREVEIPFAGTIALGAFALPLSLFWLACFPHAFNFMDGIDGISGLTALVSGLAFAAAGLLAGDDRTAALGAVVAGAAVGFLPWNVPKARIFMGDSGSLPLGMALAVVAGLAAEPSRPGAAPALPFPAAILLFGPYLFDVTFTLVRRAREGKPLGQAHKEHLYQRLARGLGGHVPSALTYAALAIVTSVLALAWSGLGDLERLLSLLTPLAALLASARWVLATESRRAGPGTP
jgi:UDP-N-acetylmuramyl pentapeptide phosphotransferase/UDP-N-acetylglucosamine-1-phosphate transferase